MKPVSRIRSRLFICQLVLTLIFSKLSVAFYPIPDLTDESKTRIHETEVHRVTVHIQANKFVLVYGSIEFQTGICLANLNGDYTCKCMVNVIALMMQSTLEGDLELDRGSAYLCPQNNSNCTVKSEVGKSGTLSCSYSIRLNLNSNSDHWLSNSKKLAQFSGTNDLRVTAVADIAVYAEERQNIAVAIMPLKGFTVKLPALFMQDRLLSKTPQPQERPLPQDNVIADPETGAGTPDLKRGIIMPDPYIDFPSCMKSSNPTTTTSPNSSVTNAAKTQAGVQPSCRNAPSHASRACQSVSWSIIELPDAKLLRAASLGSSDSSKFKSAYDIDPPGQVPSNSQESTDRNEMEFLSAIVSTAGKNLSKNSSCQLEASEPKNAVELGWMIQLILTFSCAVSCAACSYWVHSKLFKKKIHSSAAVSNSSVQSPIEPENNIMIPSKTFKDRPVQQLKVERQLMWSDDEDLRSEKPSEKRPISKGGRCTHKSSLGLKHEINHGSNTKGMPLRTSVSMRSWESPTDYQKGGWTRDEQGRLRRLLPSGSRGIHTCEGDFLDELAKSEGRVEAEETLSAEMLHSGPNISHLLSLEHARNPS